MPNQKPEGFQKIFVLGVVFFTIFSSVFGVWLYINQKKYKPSTAVSPKQQIKRELFADFSKLIISPANAKNNFSFRPVKSDSLGVDVNSAYVLKSKEPLSTEILKKNLSVEPKVDFELKQVNDKEWQLIPRRPLKPNTLFKVALAASYKDEFGQERQRDYSWVFQIKDSFKVIHAIPRDGGTNVPVDTGIEITFSHENYKDYKKYFTIEPAVEGSFERHGRTLVFVPKDHLQNSTLYTVTIKKGLPLDNCSDFLSKDYSFIFETVAKRISRRGIKLKVYNQTIETTINYPPLIRIWQYNAPKKVEVALYKFKAYKEYLESIKERDSLPWWSEAKKNFLFDVNSLIKDSSFSAEIKDINQKKFIEFPKPLEPGFYLAELSVKTNKVQVWIQVSNLAVYYNITKTDTLVWVNDTIAKQPANNAMVEIIGLNTQYKTNNRGLAVFPTPLKIKQSNNNSSDNKDKEIYYFKISKGNDVLILPASQSSVDYWWERIKAADDYWLYLYTDRPRYQPTDVIKFWGMLKSRHNQPITKKITLTLFKEGYVDYYYRPVKIIEKEIELSDLDTFTGKIDLKNLRPDYYTLELKVGGELIKRKYLTIRPYTKPAYNLSLIPDKKVAFADEPVKLKVKASFFEGTPVPNLKLIFKARGHQQSLTTNDQGEADLTFSKDYYSCQTEYSCWPRYVHLSVYPENSELAEITAETNLRFYGPKVYAVFKTEYPEKGVAEVNITTKFYDLDKLNQDNWWLRDKDDKVAPNTKIKGKVIKVTYNKKEAGTYYDFIAKRTYKTYNYIRNEEKVRDFSFSTDQSGHYVFRQTVEPETSYYIIYQVYDSEGRFDNYKVYLYYYDGQHLNYYYDQDYDYYHLKLPEKKNGFSVNETVKVEFLHNNEPTPGKEQGYLFMQLQNGLQEYKVENNSIYTFSFEKRDIPNINLVAVYFNGLSYITAGTDYFGERQISYNFNNRRLKIEVDSNKEKYQPGEEVELKIKVTDKNNNPIRASVNLNLVDEAYYAVVNDLASPLETIYTPLGSGSLFSRKTHENLFIERESDAEMGGCFVAGTKVLMADGSLKAIETIKKGEKVKTFADPLSRELVVGEVSEVWEHKAGEYLLINSKLKVTPEHQVFSNYRFIDAGMLKVGDWLLNYKGEKIIIESIKVIFEDVLVYNLRVDPQHSFFAGGFYVHNQEKGGGPRELFTDAALFKTVTTDANGQAQVKFKLPDNITSWRVTAQGISDDLYAGVSVTKIPVSLPVFAEVTVGEEYLLTDKPIVRLRAYGVSLNKNDKVYFTVQAESLGVKESESIPALAFKPAYYPLPDLLLGRHNIIYNLKTAKGNDAIKLPIDVTPSRLVAKKAISSKLTTETKAKAINNLPFMVVLMDEGQNKLYGPLKNLSWARGDRVDEKYVSQIAGRILKKYYNEEIKLPPFKPYYYQLTNGGLSLLPYSSDELELSLRITALGEDDFDQEALAQYFLKKLDSKDSNREEVTMALAGLALLKRSVLTRINDWLGRDDLTIRERLYIALALSELGDKERARSIYYDILSKYGRQKEPQVFIQDGKTYDDTFAATILGAVVASVIDAPEAEGMFNYVLANQRLSGRQANSENLFNLEKLNYIKNTLPKLKPSPAKVEYELFNEKKEVEITRGQFYSFQLDPTQADELKFLKITGNVGVSFHYLEPLDLSTVKRDRHIGIRREYYINKKKTNRFKENDLIEIRLYPRFSKEALAGYYQITDILPSGLIAVTKLYNRFGGAGNCRYWYPYNREGQMVKYRISRDWQKHYCGGDYIVYYARVKNKGEYIAEPAIIQSFENPNFINYSSQDKIYIE